jgi:hypothetical protein
MFNVDINSMNGDYKNFAYNLLFLKENSKSIYAESPVYGWMYRIEKSTGKVFRDGKQIADICDYVCY